jgi:hypothetical protein
MSVRVQVILKEEEATRFKSQALKESKSLSAWLRDAGNKMIEVSREQRRLTDPDSLKRFFQKCNQLESGIEPDWEDHKRLILDSYQAGNKP